MTGAPIVGFTGTREGMTAEQIARVEQVIDSLSPQRAHHGDCIGADAEFHLICNDRDIPIWIHPPLDPSRRAFMVSGGVVCYTPKRYLVRNGDIVNSVNFLIAAPKARKEIMGSGTWSTIRYAKTIGRHALVIYPDGTYEEHNA